MTLAGRDPSSVMRQDAVLGELKKALEGRNHRNGSTRSIVQATVAPTAQEIYI